MWQLPAMATTDISAIYDRYASRAYTLALYITRDRNSAAEILEDVFVRIGNGTLVHDETRGTFESWLLRTIRDIALERREARSPVSPVHTNEVTPRTLVEEAFFGGLCAADLSRAYSLPEEEVRRRLCTGMADLRTQFLTA
jgi:hypothetical protein